MPVIVPCRTDYPDYQFQVVLDDVTFTLRFRWSSRESFWYVDVMQEDLTPIRMGVKVTVNTPLDIWDLTDPARPAGILMAVNTSQRHDEAGYQDLGGRVVLYYISALELEQLNTLLTTNSPAVNTSSGSSGGGGLDG